MNKPACQESSIFLSEIRDTSLTSSTLKGSHHDAQGSDFSRFIPPLIPPLSFL